MTEQFFISGAKIYNSKNLYQKRKQGEVKDLTDIKLIEAYMDSNTKLLFNTFKQRHYYFNVILRFTQLSF